jgi:hypothetical protein
MIGVDTRSAKLDQISDLALQSCQEKLMLAVIAASPAGLLR